MILYACYYIYKKLNILVAKVAIFASQFLLTDK